MISTAWQRFWMRFAGITPLGRRAAWLAGLFLPPFLGRIPLSRMNSRGYVSPRAVISHPLLKFEKNVFLDDGVMVYQDEDGGAVELEEGVYLLRDTILQTGQGGTIRIGQRTHVQPRCQFSAYVSSITIGQRVEIAPYCAFYPYNHGMAAGTPIRRQLLYSKGDIVIEDDAWLSVGVTVLDGVRIGKGAVIGAGAVVTKDIPADAIASGVPARVVRMRGEEGKGFEDPSKGLKD